MSQSTALETIEAVRPASLTPSSSPPSTAAPASDAADAALSAVSASLLRRGYLTTEFWITLIGAGLSSVLAVVKVPGATAAQVVAIGAPALLAATYAVVRTMHKSRVGRLVAYLLPQSDQNP